jgi:hypothetical protein
VQVVFKAKLEPPVLAAYKVKLEQLVRQVLKVLQDHKDHKDLLEQLVQVDLKVQLDHKAHKGHKDQQVQVA